jgi:hypothetical protein
VPTSSSAFETPSICKNMMGTLAPLFGYYIGLDLIFNDSFVRIIKVKEQKGAFGLPSLEGNPLQNDTN